MTSTELMNALQHAQIDVQAITNDPKVKAQLDSLTADQANKVGQDAKDTKDEIGAKQADADLAPARPQILAVRGGSLGFPSAANSEGVLAGVDAKVATGTSELTGTSSADAFAKVGGIRFSRFIGEVIAESFDADIPVITLGQPAIPIMTKSGFSSVGLRIRMNSGKVAWASTPLSETCQSTLAIAHAVKNEQASASASDTLLASAPKDCKQSSAIVTRDRVWSYDVGLRAVRRGASSESFANIGGLEWELGLRRDSEAHHVDGKNDDEQPFSWSGMLGLAGMHLSQDDVVASGVDTRYIKMNDVRLSFALEARGIPKAGDTTTAALGVYGVYSQDYWTNHFQVGGVTHVRDYQLEGGIYVSGVMKGFSGLVMVSVIRPYAHDGETQVALSVIPFGGAATVKKEN